jgi:hypothetical protein
MFQAKVLNQSGGVNRIRFENFSKRLQQINTDVVHRIGRMHFSLSDEKDNNGNVTSYLEKELEQCKYTDISTDFQIFYHKLTPFVKSLAEVIHHLKQIVSIISNEILSIGQISLPSILKITACLVRYVATSH